MDVKGVLWHSTGANNPNLKRYVQPDDNAPDKAEWLLKLGVNSYKNDWNHTTVQAGLNGWIGKLADGTVTTIQTMPWNYRPWGCGSGSKGSCNNGWIQFEICEDGLTDKDYFDKVYKEACELTAYLCKMFNLDPNGTVDMNGVKVPVILCHADSCQLGLGSNHGDVNHWFPKFGKSMATARADVAALLKETGGTSTPAQPTQPSQTVYYRVRKTWADATSQKGAFTELANAKKLVDSLGAGYYVFDESGKAIYPETIVPTPPATGNVLKVGDEVKLVSGATYTSGQSIPAWVFNSKLYVREIQGENIVFSTLKTGAITGVTKASNLVPYSGSSSTAPSTPTPPATSNGFNVGDTVKLIYGAKYTSGQTIPGWVFSSKLYVRELQGDNIVISTLASGAITGVVNKQYLIPYSATYKVEVNVSALNIRAGASTSYKVVAQATKGKQYTILEIKGDWGRANEGWMYLPYTKKV